MVNDDPTTEQGDTAEVEILPAPGPCEGNLVLNGGFEEGWAGWEAGLGCSPDRAAGALRRVLAAPGVSCLVWIWRAPILPTRT